MKITWNKKMNKTIIGKLDEIMDLASELKVLIDTPVSKVDMSPQDKELLEQAGQLTAQKD